MALPNTLQIKLKTRKEEKRTNIQKFNFQTLASEGNLD